VIISHTLSANQHCHNSFDEEGWCNLVHFKDRCSYRLKFHLARLDSTRHVRLCRASRASRASRDERVERDEPCTFNMADDERSCTSL